MYTLIAQNKYGQQLELTHNAAYSITNIDGISPPDGVINTTRNANADGSVFNSSYVDNRTITITLSINSPAEQNRINLYKYFKAKFPTRLYYSNATRNVYIDGYVQNIHIGFFDKKQVAQITILCPNPFFQDVNESLQEFINIEDLFEFPFSVEESANLLPNTMETGTISGITFTVNDDKTITVDGQSSDYTWGAYVNESLSLPAGSYILNGCPGGGASTTYRLQLFAGDPSSPTLTVNDYGSGANFTLNAATTVSVRILAKGTIDDLLFEPMIRLSSIEDDDYVEYGNPDGEIEFSSIDPTAEQSIINYGDVDTGVIISIHANGPVTTPKIYNVDTGESMIINVTMADGDDIVIDTKKGEKSVLLTSNGVTTNIIGNLQNGSVWLQLAPGDNLFTVTAEATPENMQISFVVADLYEGV